MNRSVSRICSSLSALALAALGCGSDSGPPDDAAVADGAPLSLDSTAGEVPLSTPSGVVVVGSDYISATSISFLDTEGNLVQDGCFNSGTGGFGLTLTLSGDVVLPSQVPPGGPVIIIDRGNAVLTWLDPATCAPLRQLAVATGFPANPHDVVVVSPSKAYVTRANENGAATPATDDFDDGNDLLVIDPSQPKIVGRIDLRPFAAADGIGILPQADRAILADGRVYVSLNQISGDYKSYGTGRVVIVDPTTDQVIGAVDLGGAKNCGALAYVSAEKRLLVACDGAYSDGPAQAASSAIVAVDIVASPPAVVAQIPAATVGGLLFSGTALAALEDGTILAVTLGDVSGAPADRLWALSLAGGQPQMVFESAEGFALGAVIADGATGRAFLADGTSGTPAFLRLFNGSGGVLTAGPTVKTNPAQKLPPRSLAFY
jgi:hypothetical protein